MQLWVVRRALAFTERGMAAATTLQCAFKRLDVAAFEVTLQG